MRPSLLIALVTVIVLTPFVGDAAGRVGTDCTVRGINLYGKVKLVEHFPTFKVQRVEHFPVLGVQWVEHFPKRKRLACE